MTTLSAINVKFTADTTGFEAGQSKVSASLKNQGRQLSQSAANFAKWGAAATAAVAAVAVSITRQNMLAIDSTAKLARSLDGTIDGLQALRMAAGDAGIDGLDESLNRLNRRLGAVEMEAGPAAKTIERLGLDLDYIRGLDVDQRIGAIADRMIELDMSSQEAARHLQQLGFEQAGAIELFRGGSESIARYRQEVDAFGLSLSEIDAARIEQANDAMGILGDITQAVGQQMAVAAAGPLKAMAEAIEQAWIETDNFGLGSVDFQQKFSKAIASALKGIASLVRVLESDPAMIQFGIIGKIFFGSKGAAIGASIGFVFGKIRDELRLLGIGVDDDAAKMARLVKRAEEIQQAMAGAEAARARGQNVDRQIANNARMLEIVNAEIETLRSTMSEDSWEDFNNFFVEGASTAGQFADELDRVAQAVEDAAESGGISAPFGQTGAPAGVSGTGLSEAQAAYDAMQALLVEANSTWLDTLSERFMTEEEMLNAKLWDDLERLRESYDQKLIDQQEFNELSEKLAEDHAQAMKNIDQEQSMSRQQINKDMLQNMSQLMNSESRKLFNIGKIAAISQALLDARSAVVSAYKHGSAAGGPILGAAYAATAAAASAVHVARIKSQTYGGGGDTTSYSGGVPVQNTPQTAAEGGVSGDAGMSRNISISMQGRFFSDDLVRDLIDQINNQIGDGVTLRTT